MTTTADTPSSESIPLNTIHNYFMQIVPGPAKQPVTLILPSKIMPF